MKTLPDDTSRLHFREISEADFDFVYRLQGDPDVMRYIRAATDDPQVIHDRLGFWINYRSEQPQLGVFIATETASGSPVGYCVARHVEWQAGKEL